MTNQKHIIYTNDLDFDDFCATALQDRIADGWYEDELTDSEKWNEYYDYLECSIEDTCMLLDKELENPILAIADLGLWNGRVQGYKILNNSNLSEILNSNCDYCTWYYDGYNVKSKECHHDGTNYVEYRVIRNMNNIGKLLNKIYNNEVISRNTLNYYTRSLAPEMNFIYGW